MSHTFRSGQFVAAVVVSGLLSTAVLGQSAKPEAPPVAKDQGRAAEASPEQPQTQMRVQVTVARYAGEKKTTSLPFTLWVPADGTPATLNVGQRVSVPGPKEWTTHNIGTSISCRAGIMSDGRFRLTLTLNDSHLSPATAGEPVVLKSLQANNLLYLRDGQTAEFVASTDLVTGEVTRIEVTASVLK